MILLLQPETGDDLQWEKAGVLEVADVIAVQKADLPKAEQVAEQVRAALELSDGPPIPVLLVSAKTGQNIAQLWQILSDTQGSERSRDSRSTKESELLRLAIAEMTRRFQQLQTHRSIEMQEVANEYQQGRLSEREVGQVLFDLCSTCSDYPEKRG